MEPISPYAPRPVRRPVMLQRWQNLTFLHWRYEPGIIGRMLPQGLQVDTFEGYAWVGLTPFVLYNLRVPFTPAAPWISRFPETNVRTYVKGPDGERGVWFFTLEADRLLAVLAARAIYHLPYRWAAMRVRQCGEQIVEYQSRRKRPFAPAQTDIAIRRGERIVSGPFDNFLTARYRLYTTVGKQTAFADIDHEPWSLHTGTVLRLQQNLVQRCELPPPVGEPTVHVSIDLAVRIGRLQLFAKRPVRIS
ncbi:MAG: DUF2071 domain-containing protein [Acidobacteriaceae bacterium]|nr:DUF2071 domain-containing protein [Acidobacteriaceae bacterium]